MEIRHVDYNGKSGNAVVNDRDIGVCLEDYIYIALNEERHFILDIIAHFNYILYEHIRDFFSNRFDKSTSTVNEILRELEGRGMIASYYLNSYKYAMLSTKGMRIISSGADAKPKRKPRINDLKKQAYFAEACKTFHEFSMFDFCSLHRYLDMYRDIQKNLSRMDGFNEKDSDGYSAYYFVMDSISRSERDFHAKYLRRGRCIEWDDIERIRNMGKREMRDYLENLTRVTYQSASEYLKEQINTLEHYLKLSLQARTRAERDDLSTLQNQGIYYCGVHKDNQLLFTLLDFGLSDKQILNAVLSIDACFERMHQLIPKKCYTFGVRILTYSQEREERIKTINEIIADKINNAHRKIWEEFSVEIEGKGQCFDYSAWIKNKYRYKGFPRYAYALVVQNLDIQKYFEPNCKGKNYTL